MNNHEHASKQNLSAAASMKFKIWRYFLVIVLVFSGISGGIIWTVMNKLSERQTAEGWDMHTRDVLLAAEQSLSALQDAETGQHGYLITQRTNYLEPYNAAIDTLSSTLDRLAALTVDNAPQQARIGELRRVATAQLAALAQGIAFIRQGDQKGAFAFVNGDSGKALMDEARTLLAAINGDELGLLEERHKSAEHAAARSVTFVETLAAANLLLLLAALTATRFALRASEKARLSALLVASTARFQELADNIPQLAWTARPDGWIFWYNWRWFDYTGATLEGMQGAGWQTVCHPDHVARVVAHFYERLASGESWEDTFPLRGKDGAFRWFLARARPILDDKGRVELWFGTNTDVTESRAAEAANALLAAIVTSTEDAILSIDPENGQVLTWNRGAEKLFGYKAAEIVGSTTARLVPPDLPDSMNQLDWMKSGHTLSGYEIIRVAKNGERIPLSVTSAIMKAPDGRVVGISGIYNDLRQHHRTEAALRETEAQLRQAQKLEAVGRLVAGVAHDFNNILQGVTGGLELVLDDVEVGTPTYEFAEIALTSARRGASLTQHLLSYAHKQALQPKPVDVALFLSEMKRLLSRTLDAQIVVEVRAERGLPAICLDPGQLHTALLNLAINASHAMPNGGRLLLDARVDGGNRQIVAVSVTDTGVGMDKATQAQACEPFFTTKGLDGSGLGLSMVQGFAGQSGGEMRIESAPGAGTTVELRFPAVPPASIATEPRAAPMAARGSGLVLLVDDNADVLVTTGAFLRWAGFQVIRAANGNEALTLLTSGDSFDALVSDYAMPGMDGVDLIAQARLLHPKLAAVLITGFAEAVAADRLPDRVLVLRKPFQRSELIETLQRALEGVTSPFAQN